MKFARIKTVEEGLGEGDARREDGGVEGLAPAKFKIFLEEK